MDIQIRRDITKDFYSANVRTQSKEERDKIIESMKYFKLEGFPCRSFGFDINFLGANRDSFNKDHTVFVVFNCKEKFNQIFSQELHQFFEREIGPVKSAKAGIDKDHKSIGFGFVSFEH